ncbi:MAG: DUF177 domain-containing protein [Bacteroidetes bacterium]|jgi:uncharacterized protein|nr:DUF177 domain-containing protein [Bacteroidota bacterium]
MLTIDLRPLAEGLHRFDFAPAAEALDLPTEQFADIGVAVQVNYYDDRALVLLQATAEATLECDRTLQTFTQPIEGAYQLLFAPPDFAERHRGEETEEYQEVRPMSPGDPRIDLTDVARDTLLLALPQRRVAPGAEDLELETTYGASEADPIDPRWEALRELRTEMEGEGDE